jgi:acyl-CoA thioesterase
MSFTTDTAILQKGEFYHSEIKPGWDIQGNANGGYLMAIGARAMAAASRLHPVSVTAHFLSPGKAGPVTVMPTIVKHGRTFSTVIASVMGPQKPIIELLGSFGEVVNVDGAVLVDAEPPKLPAPEKCVKIEPHPGGFPTHRIQCRSAEGLGTDAGNDLPCTRLA